MNQGHFHIVGFTSITVISLAVLFNSTSNFYLLLSLLSLYYVTHCFRRDFRYRSSNCSVVLGCAYGDEGKGKITKVLLEPKPLISIWNISFTTTLKEYYESHKLKVCIRFGGANNAGHTVYDNDGNKIITHSVPTGIVNGCISIIGKGCLVNPKALKEEMEMLRSFNINGSVYVDKNAHVITDEHIQKDAESEMSLEKDNTEFKGGANGSTKKGVRFCAADKALRVGKRVYTVKDLFANVPGFTMIDTQQFLQTIEREHQKNNGVGLDIIMEGAQGYKLDPDTGDYPYCTSTGCNLAQVLTSGIIPKWLDLNYGIWGAQKLPTSYVGTRKYMREGCPDLIAFQKFPSCPERGSTTGRWRQVDYPNLHDWVNAINENNINHLVINKCDIIDDIYYGRYPKGENDDNPEYQFEHKSYSEILTVLIPKNTPLEHYYNPHYTVDLPFKADTYDSGDETKMTAIIFYDNDHYYDFIKQYLFNNCRTLKNVHLSYSPKEI